MGEKLESQKTHGSLLPFDSIVIIMRHHEEKKKNLKLEVKVDNHFHKLSPSSLL